MSANVKITGTVELLLDNLASLNIKQKDGRGILWAAGAGGSEEVMDLILLFKSKLDLEVSGGLNINKWHLYPFNCYDMVMYYVPRTF